MPVRQPDGYMRRRLAGPRAALRCRLPPPVAAPEPAHTGQGRRRRGRGGSVRDHGLSGGRLVRARGLRPLRNPVRRSSRPAAHSHGLRVRGPSAAQGFPADRLRRGALRRRGEAGRLRAGAAEAGISLLRFPEPLGGNRVRLAGGRKGELTFEGARALGWQGCARRTGSTPKATPDDRAQRPQLQHQLRATTPCRAWCFTACSGA